MSSEITEKMDQTSINGSHKHPFLKHCHSSEADFSRIDSNSDLPRSTYRRLIDRINDRINKNSLFCSFEFFPPKTVQGSINLIKMFVYYYHYTEKKLESKFF